MMTKTQLGTFAWMSFPLRFEAVVKNADNNNVVIGC